MRFKYSFWESKIPRWTGLSSECLSHVSRNHRGPEECTRGGFKANKVIMLTGCLFRNTTSNIFWQKNDLKKRKKKISPKLHVQQFLKCLSLKWSTSSDLCLFHQTLSVKEDWGDFLQQMWCAFINQKSKSIKKKRWQSWADVTGVWLSSLSVLQIKQTDGRPESVLLHGMRWKKHLSFWMWM